MIWIMTMQLSELVERFDQCVVGVQVWLIPVSKVGLNNLVSMPRNVFFVFVHCQQLTWLLTEPYRSRALQKLKDFGGASESCLRGLAWGASCPRKRVFLLRGDFGLALV